MDRIAERHRAAAGRGRQPQRRHQHPRRPRRRSGDLHRRRAGDPRRPGGNFSPGPAIAGPPGTVDVTSSFEEASVTTGGSSAEFGNAQSGVIAIQTRSGGSSSGAAASGFENDEIGGLNHSLRLQPGLQAGFGGPIVGNLTFFLSGDLEGAKSERHRARQARGTRSSSRPGVDTTVAVIVMARQRHQPGGRQQVRHLHRHLRRVQPRAPNAASATTTASSARARASRSPRARATGPRPSCSTPSAPAAGSPASFLRSQRQNRTATSTYGYARPTRRSCSATGTSTTWRSSTGPRTCPSRPTGRSRSICMPRISGTGPSPGR